MRPRNKGAALAAATATALLLTACGGSGDGNDAPIAGADQGAEHTPEPEETTAGDEPEDADADLFPRSGRCPINGDGSVGTPYTTGRSGDDPPCGLIYRRATHHVDSYPMTASITWEVSREGSGGTGDTLPTAVFDTTHDIEVMEVQAVVRRPRPGEPAGKGSESGGHPFDPPPRVVGGGTSVSIHR
ncbi:hypothetical protein FNQ90_02990 [Streptomyces alkaliphilus]|uniref:Lipoprotein n=1 Tax=Streptomyces alkaliphilus TaxID=1472722 RepID=A0A7W3Y0A6_9ACTN|nr:hypothetical protein [Streptomyces alkaliphilus]MBB0243101.1 hypothetical protein [Streptomyces alkaliphilus]